MRDRAPGAPAVDFANMTADALDGRGIDPARLAGDLADRFRAAHAAVESERAAGRMGFFGLPFDRALAARASELAETLARRRPPADVVVVGIGGSALGAAAIRDALLGPRWNELSASARGGRPRLHVLDSPDPDSALALLDCLDLSRTVFNVVSKSGSTAETLAHLLVALRRLEDALGPDAARSRLVVTTDPERGPLRRLANERGLASLPVPPDVGGRFSVLSPVGLFPAALAGARADELLAGAADMARRCETADLARNPAGILATLLHAADADEGAGIHVLMPYADRLGGFAYWLQQLWAESLGKALRLDGTPAGTGPTPLPAFGPMDQHSLLQLFVEGPRDKVVVFFAAERPETDAAIPPPPADVPAAAHLGGRTLFELLDSERRATAEALRRSGRMNLTVSVNRVDARSLGALFMLWQVAVALAAALYGVNPLDQPGVELGKSLTARYLDARRLDAPPP